MWVSGSPPRAWGPRHNVGQLLVSVRFTPTRVGTTRGGTRASPRREVHPHARGDQQFVGAWPVGGHGSPPRAWGPPGGSLQTGAPSRFTPTRVGTTAGLRMRGSSGSVHPHARGDHASQQGVAIWIAGSPPRAWGPPGLAGCPDHIGRFTPTRVGTTLPGREKRCDTTVHPHARGDHSTSSRLPSTVYGSPPRAWGPR